MTWEWIAIALPWAFLLLCPLAMYWMMRGMHDGGGKRAGAAQEGTSAAAPARGNQEEIGVLKERLARLEAEKRSTGSQP